jgi:hypothetical protein
MNEYTPDLFEDTRNVCIFRSLQDLESVCCRNDFPMDRTKLTGYVYAVEFAEDLKIGFSTDLWTRLHTLNSKARIYRHSSLGRIAFTGRIEHYRSLEHHLHLRFFNKRLEPLGELFDLSFELAVEGLRTEPAAPFAIETAAPASSKQRRKKQNPRGSAARLRNLINTLYSL